MNGSGPRSSVSTMRALDWTTLSPRAAAILRTIAIPHSEGYSLIEIGHELGITRRSVCLLLDELRDEIGESRLCP